MQHVIDLAEGVRLELDERAFNRLVAQLAAPAARVRDLAPPRSLGDDHPYWERHTGGSGHSEPPEWTPEDGRLAEAFYAGLTLKAKVFMDIVIDHPGRLLTTDEITKLAPETFANHYAIAGSINGLRKLREDAGRRYPFYWWTGTPTTYAMKPFVADLFRNARSAIGR